MEVSINGGTKKNERYIMENPIKMGDLGVSRYPHFRKPSYIIYVNPEKYQLGCLWDTIKYTKKNILPSMLLIAKLVKITYFHSHFQ